jgi:ankyrin repeat protein
MRRLLAGLIWATAVLVPLAPAGTDRRTASDELSVAIIPSGTQAGRPVLNREDGFQVVLTNRSSKLIRVWCEGCQAGYENVTFHVQDRDGASWAMFRNAQPATDWQNLPLRTSSIAPGGSIARKVKPGEGSWWPNPMWQGVPEPNTGKPIKFTAIFEIRADPAATQHNVWTGRIASEPIEALFIDPKLQTPNDYLKEGYPKRALAIMRTERTWLTKRDKDNDTPLRVAASYGHTDVVRWLLENGADPSAQGFNGQTALWSAEEPEIAKLLIEHKARLNSKENASLTAALEKRADDYARFAREPDCKKQRDRNWAVIGMLLAAGAEYNLHSAIYLNDLARVRALLAKKEAVHDKLAMRIACTEGRAAMVKLLLEHGADPNDPAYSELDPPPLSYFALDHADVLKLLLDAGANPKATFECRPAGPKCCTLLHWAALNGSLESARLLLARGVDVNVKDELDQTPLHYACHAGRLDIVNLLLDHKANVKGSSRVGTPMSQAVARFGHDPARFETVIRALARAGAEVNVFAAIVLNDVPRFKGILKNDPRAGAIVDPNDDTVLYEAVKYDRREIVKLLLDRGYDADLRRAARVPGYQNGTPLFAAATWGRVEMAELLISRGAKVNAKAGHGYTALHDAVTFNQPEMVELLLKHGADINAKTADGKTPVDCADVHQFPSDMQNLLHFHGAR